MPIFEDARGRAVAIDARPGGNGYAPVSEAERAPSFTTVKEAVQHGTLDQVEEAVCREAIGQLTEPYFDSLSAQGYRDIGGVAGPGPWQGPIDLYPEQRRMEVQWARTLALFSPPAKNALRLHRTYVLGQGIPMPTAPDKDVQDVIADFWDDPANGELTQHTGQAETDASWLITGELFLALYVDDTDGHVKVRSVEPLDVDSIVTDPDDRRRILYYRVRQHRDTFDFGQGQQVDDVRPGAPDEYVYFPDWENTDPARDPYTGKAGPKAPGGAVMASFPLNRQGVRGVPEFCAATPWIHSHKRLIENQSVMSEARKRISLIKTVKGGPQAVGSSAALDQSSLASDLTHLERNPARAPGATYVKNKGIELEYPDLSTGADDAQRDAELQAQMIGSALGWGTHYLLMSTEFHRLATAVTMELPTLKMCLEGQQRWLDMLRSVLDFALLWAAKKKTIDAPVLKKHGRELVDWKKAAPAPPDSDEDDDEAPASPVREMEPQDVLAQGAQQDEGKTPESTAKKAKAQRGHFTIDLPPILQRDLQPTITAIEAAATGGHITPEQAAQQIMLVLGFGEVSDAMEEWRRWVELKGSQIEREAQQAQDMAHKALASKAGGPAGSTPDAGAAAGQAQAQAQARAPGSGQAAPSGGMSRSPVREAEGADGETVPFEDDPVVREAAGAGHWVTIEEEGIQTHIFIQGGRVTKGPAGLIGATPGHLPPGPSRTVTHHPVGHEPAGARDHPHFAEHQPPPKPEPKPGKPYARLSGAAQTRQSKEQPAQAPAALDAHATKHGLLAAQAATRAQQISLAKRAEEEAAARAQQEAERTRDHEERAAAEKLHTEGTQAERAHVAAATPAIRTSLGKQATTPAAKKALTRILSGHRTPAHQLLALAEGVHQWSPGYNPDASAENRAAAAGIMSVPWPQGTGAAASDAYVQASRHLRDLTKEKGALPSRDELDAYVRHGIARRVGPHLADAFATSETTEGVSPEHAERAKADVAREDTIAGQMVALMRARMALQAGRSMGRSSADMAIIWDAAAKAASAYPQQNAISTAYTDVRHQINRFIDDNGRLPRSGAELELYSDTHHDAPTDFAERRAYMRARAFRPTFARTRAEARVPVRPGPVRAAEHDARSRACWDAAGALPSIYRRLYVAMDNDITVHGQTYVEHSGRDPEHKHPMTGLPARRVGGTYDGRTSNIYGDVHASGLGDITRHEMGHGIDEGAGRLRGEVSPGGSYVRSRQRDFQAIYDAHKENKKLWWYMRATPGEMFAEGFNQYHHDLPAMREALHKAAPDLHDFFANLEQEVAGYGVQPED